MPVLVFAGERDLRTPVSNAAAIAARFPQGHLVTVPGVGHSVLGADLTRCAQDAVGDGDSRGEVVHEQETCALPQSRV